MRITDNTFAAMTDALHNTYLNWELPDESVTTWKNILSLAISDEFYPMVILDWITNVVTPPKNPAEIIKYASDMVAREYGSADNETEILINSARSAYTVSDDFLSFSDEYSTSFASIAGTPAQEAYIIHNIREHASSPNILILVFDECKGALKDCFTGDVERGVEFLRNQIKKSWKSKSTDIARTFLMSGETKVNRNPRLQDYRNPRNLLNDNTTDQGDF